MFLRMGRTRADRQRFNALEKMRERKIIGADEKKGFTRIAAP